MKLSNLWPFVSKAKYELALRVKNEYAKECVELRKEVFQQLARSTGWNVKYLHLKDHVKKVAPHALKKRNSKGQFTGETW